MKVPYSMDDGEPDLYGGMGGYNDDEYTQTKCESEDRSYAPLQNVRIETIEIPKWYTQEQMTAVIQNNIVNTRHLEIMILEARELLQYVCDNSYSHRKMLGISQKVREFLTNDRREHGF